MINGVRFRRSTYIQTASATPPSPPSMHRLRSFSGVINLVILADQNLAASAPDLRTDALTVTSLLSGLSGSLFVRIRS